MYCNRNLRLDQVKAVGFDMDYTLAIYRQAEMDRLSIDATVSKLVDRGYPEELLSMKYRTDFPIRGLLIDRKLGNVLKMDRYRYVKTAYHGFRKLSREERRRAYHTRRLRPGTGRYHWVDTLYSLSERGGVCRRDRVPGAARGHALDYGQLFADIRECADISHQDGSILDVVLGDLPRYVDRDPDLGLLLHKLRSAGKRLFLVTNSGSEYTNAMMSYLARRRARRVSELEELLRLHLHRIPEADFFHGEGALRRFRNGTRRAGIRRAGACTPAATSSISSGHLALPVTRCSTWVTTSTATFSEPKKNPRGAPP